MAFYSPDRTYGGRVDFMAHEDVLCAEEGTWPVGDGN